MRIIITLRGWWRCEVTVLYPVVGLMSQIRKTQTNKTLLSVKEWQCSHIDCEVYSLICLCWDLSLPPRMFHIVRMDLWFTPPFFWCGNLLSAKLIAVGLVDAMCCWGQRTSSVLLCEGSCIYSNVLVVNWGLLQGHHAIRSLVCVVNESSFQCLDYKGEENDMLDVIKFGCWRVAFVF